VGDLMAGLGLRRNTGGLAAAALALAFVAGCGPSATPSLATPLGSAAAATPSAAANVASAAPNPTAAAAPSPTADPYALAAMFEGTYKGTWVNETYGSSGPASIKLTLDRTAGAMDLTLTLGGNVFGQAAPSPEQLVAKLTPGVGMSFTSKTFGQTTVKADLSSAGTVITITSPNVPSAAVRTFTAKATVTNTKTINLAYEVTFRNGAPKARGSAKLTR
jgi:hypothetical protein